MDGSEKIASSVSAFVLSLDDVLGAALGSNYAFKPTAEQALRMDRGWTSRGGLTRRWISEAVAGCGRAA